MTNEKEYRTEFSDGFVTNQKRKKTHWIGHRIVYSVIEPDSVLIRGGNFIPTWNSTDHLAFACSECNQGADVLEVRTKRYGDRYALYFYLGCPGCGATGQRKIYLDGSPSSHFCHMAYNNDGRVLLFGMDEERRIIESKEK